MAGEKVRPEAGDAGSGDPGAPMTQPRSQDPVPGAEPGASRAGEPGASAASTDSQADAAAALRPRSAALWPSRTPERVPVAAPPQIGPVTPEQRKKVLDDEVFERTREFRSTLRNRTDLEALLVRGRPVTHRLHFAALVLIVAVVATLGRAVGFGDLFLAPAVAVGGAYGLFWLFLTMTGGEELQRLSVDEAGRVSIKRSGRDIEARSDFLRVAVPTALLIACGYFIFSLGRDIAFPPPPNCNVVAEPGSDACLLLPNLATLTQATLPPGTLAPGQTATPAPPPTAAPTPSPGQTAGPAPTASPRPIPLTVTQAQTIERLIRGAQLLIFLLIAIATAWFLRRMVTGKWVAAIRPVRHRAIDG
jgi:hypothetical protein